MITIALLGVLKNRNLNQLASWWDRHRVLKSDPVDCVNVLDKCYVRCIRGWNFATYVQDLNLRKSYFRKPRSTLFDTRHVVGQWNCS